MRKSHGLSCASVCDWSQPATALVMSFFSSRRRHTRFDCDWSSDVCSSDLDSCVARVRRASPMSLDDGGEAEPLYHANDGRVECLARKAETHESDVEHDRDSTSCPERGHLALCVRCST